MARKRRVVKHRRARRRNYGTRAGRGWSKFTRRSRKRNPGRVRHYRRHRAVRRNRGRRRNPGMLTGFAGRVVGVIGGVAVTKFLMGFVPATFSSGILGYVATAAVAVAQGKLVGKVSKSQQVGDDFMVGGLAYLVAKVLNDFFPTVGAYTGISGMGLIGGSSFYTPQVNQAGSMGSFVVPQSVTGAIPVMQASGMGAARRRVGRLM